MTSLVPQFRNGIPLFVNGKLSFYEERVEAQVAKAISKPLGGVGTELEKLIPDWFEKSGCGCNDYARKLDRKGVDWCDEHRAEIVEHLVKQATQTFLKVLGKAFNKLSASALLATAISRSRLRDIKANGLHPASDALTLVTSLSPTCIRRQLTCLRTWQYMGFPIIAQQVDQEEIDQLAPLFPDVTFKIAEAVHENRVTIQSLAQEAKEQPVLILNADLEIYAEQSMFIEHWAGGTDCRIGFRWNYDDIQSCTQEHWGIDAVRITPAMVPHIVEPTLRLGFPGWDWWLPTHLEKAGFRLSRVNAPELFHQNHPTTWEPRSSLGEQARIEADYGITVDEMREMASKDRNGWKCSVTL